MGRLFAERAVDSARRECCRRPPGKRQSVPGACGCGSQSSQVRSSGPGLRPRPAGKTKTGAGPARWSELPPIQRKAPTPPIQGRERPGRCGHPLWCTGVYGGKPLQGRGVGGRVSHAEGLQNAPLHIRRKPEFDSRWAKSGTHRRTKTVPSSPMSSWPTTFATPKPVSLKLTSSTPSVVPTSLTLRPSSASSKASVASSTPQTPSNCSRSPRAGCASSPAAPWEGRGPSTTCGTSSASPGH